MPLLTIAVKLNKIDAYDLAVVVYLSELDQGIGARRWNKLIKAFKSKRKKVLTITSDFKRASKADIVDTVVFKSCYPIYLDHPPKTITSKLIYRLLVLNQRIQLNGYPYDKAARDKKAVCHALDCALSKGVNKFIVSGAPFDLCHIVIRHLKDAGVQIIVDFRDPWTWSEHYMKLSSVRLEIENQKEKEVLQSASKILVPADSMKRYLESKYPKFGSKIELLEHGFDREQVEATKAIRIAKHKKIIYAGTVYAGTEELFLDIARIVENENGKFVFELFANNQLSSDFYAFKYTKVYEPLSEDEYLIQIKSAHVFLSIVPSRFKDFISSKYYEIIACNTFIMIVAESGELTDFIEKNGFGRRVDASRLGSILKLCDEINRDNKNNSVQLSNYTFNALGGKVYQMFNNH